MDRMKNINFAIYGCGVIAGFHAAALNEVEGVWCERVYAPWTDMEDKMREHGISLFAQESGDAVRDFDIAAFSLQYELCYTNILYMLSLAQKLTKRTN